MVFNDSILEKLRVNINVYFDFYLNFLVVWSYGLPWLDSVFYAFE